MAILSCHNIHIHIHRSLPQTLQSEGGNNSNISHPLSLKLKQHDPHMTNQSSGMCGTCGIASVCCEAFIGSALVVQTGKPWKRLGWVNLGPHRGTLQTTFQAIHAHAIQHSLVNWTSTFPGQLKKRNQSMQLSIPSKSAASWKLSKRVN